MRVDQKSLRKGKFPAIDAQLVTFANEMADKGAKVSLIAMEEKAQEVIQQTGEYIALMNMLMNISYRHNGIESNTWIPSVERCV